MHVPPSVEWNVPYIRSRKCVKSVKSTCCQHFFASIAVESPEEVCTDQSGGRWKLQSSPLLSSAMNLVLVTTCLSHDSVLVTARHIITYLCMLPTASGCNLA
jgi:hypothetical protein